MSMLISAAFDVGVANRKAPLGTVTVTQGAHVAVVDLADLVSARVGNDVGDASDVTATTFWHHTASGLPIFTYSQQPGGLIVLREMSRYSFGGAFTTAMRAALTTAGATTPSNYSLSFNISTSTDNPRYISDYGATSHTIVWSAAAGRALCGFASDGSVAATRFTGTLAPTYVLKPSRPKASDPSPNYEPGGIATMATSDSGKSYGLSRSQAPIYRDFWSRYESKPRTFRLSADAGFPFTYEDLVQHCRTEYPFWIYQGGFTAADTETEVFSFRDAGAFFDMQNGRGSRASDVHFHWPFRCKVEGTLIMAS